MTRTLPAGASLFLLIACSDAGGTDAGSVVRDSAGIAIVENSAAAWDEGERWSIPAEPVLHVGAIEGPPEYQLDRVVDAVRLSTGGIAVANGGSQEIRIFTADGEFDRAIGRAGGGPGEFRRLGWVHALADDSLLAYDAGQRRVTVFSPGGHVVRSITLSPDTAGAPQPRGIGRLPDGGLLVQATIGWPGPPQTGLMRSPLRISRISDDGVPLNAVAELAGEELMTRVDQENRSFSVMRLPIFRSSQVAVAGAHVYVADTDRYEIRRHDPDGSLTRIIRRPIAPEPVTAADVETLVRARVEMAETPEQRRTAERVAETIDMPETKPAFSMLLADAEGNVWVQEFVWPLGGRLWSVLSPEGRWLGEVEMPERLRPTHIGRDFVVGVWRDDLDVQHVRVHAIRRGA